MTNEEAEWIIDELCRLRSDLRPCVDSKSNWTVGSTLRTPYQIDRFVKALDEVIGVLL